MRFLVFVGTKNPSKLSAVKSGVCAVFAVDEAEVEMRGVAVASGVRDQPWGATETRKGAVTRAIGALCSSEEDLSRLSDDVRVFGVGVEGGIEQVEDDFYSSEWVCVAELVAPRTAETTTALANGQTVGLVETCFGSSGRVPLDRLSVIDPLRTEDTELGVIMQRLSAQSEQIISKTVGAMGLLTNGAIPRGTATHQGICFAFGPFATDRGVYWRSYVTGKKDVVVE
jgi:non-canonical (house-cleaning) NTP pyrophosphatase